MKKATAPEWHEDLPIYRQLMDVLIGRILDRTLVEGQLLPSVRQLANDFDVNPLTVAKAYKEFSRDGFLERLRGEGLLIRKGVRELLLKRERQRFLKDEWPSLRLRLQRLGLDLRALPSSD
jgi:DNA-binding transcriptional regulator YhcF (GntR family)